MTDIELIFNNEKLRLTLLTIRKIIRDNTEDYENNDIYNIVVDALNATEVQGGERDRL